MSSAEKVSGVVAATAVVAASAYMIEMFRKRNNR